MKCIKLILLTFLSINTIIAQDTTYKEVIKQLYKIDELDQRYRDQIDYTEKKYGRNSVEINTLYRNMRVADSINLIQVEAIIDKYGWLGYDEIGIQCNTTIFMVIQHSDKVTQEKYLPIMREAVKHGKAKAKNLALLEDRVALSEGRMQFYGSQVFWNPLNNNYVVLPLEDPDNVDKRRKDVGLQPLSEYLSVWNIKWDVEEYKKNLPALINECKKYFTSCCTNFK